MRYLTQFIALVTKKPFHNISLPLKKYLHISDYKFI